MFLMPLSLEILVLKWSPPVPVMEKYLARAVRC
jgi:hypothetical protein